MLIFYLYSTTFQWFSFHSWINSLLYVLSNQWKNLIFMNIMFSWEICELLIVSVYYSLLWIHSKREISHRRGEIAFLFSINQRDSNFKILTIGTHFHSLQRETSLSVINISYQRVKALYPFTCIQSQILHSYSYSITSWLSAPKVPSKLFREITSSCKELFLSLPERIIKNPPTEPT
jgi:hypothetical protein